MEIGICAEAETDPLLALNATVPEDAPAAAVKYTVAVPPGNTLNVELLTVTPDGNPLIVPLTSWLKPLIGFTEICTCCCTPGMSERLAGCSEREIPGGPVIVSWNPVDTATVPPEPFTVMVDFSAAVVESALN